MNTKEIHLACLDAVTQCTQWDYTDIDLKRCMPMIGVSKEETLSYWSKCETLWYLGYCDILDQSVINEFKKYETR